MSFLSSARHSPFILLQRLTPSEHFLNIFFYDDLLLSYQVINTSLTPGIYTHSRAVYE